MDREPLENKFYSALISLINTRKITSRKNLNIQLRRLRRISRMLDGGFPRKEADTAVYVSRHPGFHDRIEIYISRTIKVDKPERCIVMTYYSENIYRRYWSFDLYPRKEEALSRLGNASDWWFFSNWGYNRLLTPELFKKIEEEILRRGGREH